MRRDELGTEYRCRLCSYEWSVSSPEYVARMAEQESGT
jgi:hypothetical protein